MSFLGAIYLQTVAKLKWCSWVTRSINFSADKGIMLGLFWVACVQHECCAVPAFHHRNETFVLVEVLWKCFHTIFYWKEVNIRYLYKPSADKRHFNIIHYLLVLYESNVENCSRLRLIPNYRIILPPINLLIFTITFTYLLKAQNLLAQTTTTNGEIFSSHELFNLNVRHFIQSVCWTVWVCLYLFNCGRHWRANIILPQVGHISISIIITE